MVEQKLKLKTIGVIGGLGPQATIDFESQIHLASQKLIPQFENQGYPPMLTYFIRHQPMMLNEDGTIPEILKPHPHLLDVAKMLARNVDFLVIPSNTPHIFIDEIEQATGKKVLNMISVTIAEVKKRDPKRVGILAIGHTFRSGLYQKPLEEMGIQYEGVSDEILERLNKAIFAVMEGRNNKDDTASAMKAVSYLRQKNSDVIILGCSELPLLLNNETTAPDLINPTQLLAEAAIREAIKF